MGHEDELTTEELQEILNEEHQETQRNVSPTEQEEDEKGPMPTSAIKDLFKKKLLPDHDSRCRSSVSRLQTVWLQALSWLPSDQHTGTKAEPSFIRKHNRSPLSPPMSSGRTSLASYTAMAWSQWNTGYRARSLELYLKQRISNSTLCHCGNNFSSNFVDAVKCATAVRQIRWYFLLVVLRDHPDPRLLEAVPSFDHCSQQSCTLDTFPPGLSAISWKENPPSHSSLHDLIQTP
ncbi:uncharacterized protein TNCV_4638891 [Trichonephila clavipes]|uniref:Uncharacterized protein n=1 Tax=Trichonephila clavipes TaxID=2585209 RepID=A0A8X6WD18_TRICX|nr:uncharacterized protein TNCV_4638891 [Trichonephila clavipes]